MTVVVAEKKTPQWLHHPECNQEWIAAYLPMEAGLIARVLKAARCPMCGTHEGLRMGPLAKTTGDGDWRAWVGNGDTGTSSLTIWSVLTGNPSPHGRYGIPYDPDDFGRCYRLLKVMPSWRARLGEVAAEVPEWNPFVEAWDELTAMFEEGQRTNWKPPYVMYARMRELRGEKD